MEEVAAGNLNKPFDLQIKKIALLNSSPIALTLRREFDKYVETRTQHPEYPDQLPNITNGEKFLSILSKELIILEGEAGHFGGFNLTVAIDPKRTRYFFVWIYNIGDTENKEWDVKYIDEIFFDLERLSQLEKIKSPKYARFWQ